METKNENDSQDFEFSASGRKPFVEPELSQSVSILEATSFFQIADSGATP